MKKPPIPSFDFIRVLCTFGIVFYHFSCHLAEDAYLPFFAFANGDWGSALVVTFFMLSGASLYYNYSDSLGNGKSSLGLYYYKRWMSIFPMYFLSFFSVEIIKMISAHNILFRGNPLKYVFTLLGLDGYLTGVVPVAYNLGEWFTGAIIILYIIFPLLLFFFKKKPVLTFIGVTVLFILTLNIPIVNPYPFRSITSISMCFVTGMFFIKYRHIFDRPYCAIPCIAGCLILLIFELPIPTSIVFHLTGILLFISLYTAGRLIMKNRIVSAAFSRLSRISYAVFLTHHVIILIILKNMSPVKPLPVLALLCGTTIVILIAAEILTLLTNVIMRRIDPALRKRLFPA